MSSVASELPKRRRLGLPRARWFLAFGLVGFALLGAVTFYFRFHLLWKHAEWQMGLHDVRALPDSPMPQVEFPDDWVPCRVDLLEFRLPPEMAANMQTAPRTFPGFMFRDDARAAFITRDPTDKSIALDLATAMSPTETRFTLPELRLAVHRTDARGFRWSMSPTEVRWHTHLMVHGRIVRFRDEGRIETLFHDDLVGVLHVTDDRAVFDWQCRDGRHRGFIDFVGPGEPLDLDWIRAVCRSFRVDCGAADAPGETSAADVPP